MLKAIHCVRGFALVAAGIFALGASAPGWAQAPAQEKVSAKVAKPLKAAQEATQKKQWDLVLAKVNEADAVQGKTAYDQYIINEFKAVALVGQRKFGEAATVYEQNLNSGKVPAGEVDDRLKRLIQLNTATKNYPKVMEFGDRWMKGGGQDVDTKVLVAQAHYLQKDYKNAITVMQAAIKSTEQAGRTADENWLQLVRSSQQNIGDLDGASKTLEKLVRSYPKPEYWDYLLSSRMRQKNDDRVLLNLYRLAGQVGVLDDPSEYIEMTEILLDSGLPGEAKSVMEAGYQAKVFDTADKTKSDRYKKHLTDATAQATKDQQSLPNIEKEAQKSPTGQSDVALGMAYSSFGQYDKAVAALSQGLQKGGVKDPDQAQMMLGIANLKLGKKSEAAQAFEKINCDPQKKTNCDPQMSDVARLWAIVAKSAG
jgi:tetratricopeptide (TPR) repeat protein